MKIEKFLNYPVFLYSFTRGLSYTLQFQTLNIISALLPDSKMKAPPIDIKVAIKARQAALDILKRDSENIRDGVYPLSVLKPESPVSHLLRFPKILADGISIYRRRKRGKTAEFNDEAKEFLAEVPRYYRRNFHFQTGGYLSQRSAELYEHQVEMLFGGAADAMRRMIIAPLKAAIEKRGGSPDGKGMTFLEIAGGTGRATRFVHLAFPKAKIVVTDLSHPYLKEAQKKLADLKRIDFVQADAAKLPFQDNEFDAAYSIFLFHELPFDARLDILKESKRVVKDHGFIGLVDSIQNGDCEDFEVLLKSFPENYHEPFYRNYLENPMQDVLKQVGFKHIKSDVGFFSKVCWGQVEKK